MTVSAAPLDRLLVQTRASVRAVTRPRIRAKPRVQRSNPVRTFGDWQDPLTGRTDLPTSPDPF